MTNRVLKSRENFERRENEKMENGEDLQKEKETRVARKQYCPIMHITSTNKKLLLLQQPEQSSLRKTVKNSNLKALMEQETHTMENFARRRVDLILFAHQNVLAKHCHVARMRMNKPACINLGSFPRVLQTRNRLLTVC